MIPILEYITQVHHRSQKIDYVKRTPYMDLIEEAYEDIEPLRETNPERYTVLYNRILLESMQFRYLMLSIYYTEYTEAALMEARREFRYDFERLGLVTYRENGNINELWSDWGIQ